MNHAKNLAFVHIRGGSGVLAKPIDAKGETSPTQHSPKRHPILVILAFFIPLLWPWMSYGDVLPDINVTPDQRYRIAFFPNSIPIYLYKDVSPKANLDVSRLRNDMIQHAKGNPYLEVIAPSEMDAFFMRSDLSQTDAFMQAEIDMGYARNFLENQNYPSAIELTRRVIDNYTKSLMQYYQPKSVSQAYQMLAYALIAQYQETPETSFEALHPARLAFLELIRLAPYLMMIEGRQSPERVTSYDEALELFLSNEAYRQTPQKEAIQLAHKINADILIFARIVEDKTGELYLELDEYQENSRSLTFHRKKLDLDQPEHADAMTSDVATRELSQIQACLEVHPNAPVIVQPTKARRFYIEAGTGYSVFINHSTTDILHNIGGFVFISYMFDEHFFVKAGTQIQGILQDVAHELNEPFELYQFPVHLGIAQDWDWARIYLSMGIDFAFSSTYTIVKSTECKTFGTDDIECSPSDVTNHRDPFSFLVDFAVGASFGKEPFFVNLEGIFSLTAYSGSTERAFKHPIGARLGLQYWF